jgi:hypothetical protein
MKHVRLPLLNYLRYLGLEISREIENTRTCSTNRIQQQTETITEYSTMPAITTPNSPFPSAYCKMGFKTQ